MSLAVTSPLRLGVPTPAQPFQGRANLLLPLTPFLGTAQTQWPCPEMGSMAVAAAVVSPGSGQAEEGDVEMAPRSLPRSAQPLLTPLAPAPAPSLLHLHTAAPEWGPSLGEMAGCDEGSSGHTAPRTRHSVAQKLPRNFAVRNCQF